jgi:hypothetical protein
MLLSFFSALAGKIVQAPASEAPEKPLLLSGRFRRITLSRISLKENGFLYLLSPSPQALFTATCYAQYI